MPRNICLSFFAYQSIATAPCGALAPLDDVFSAAMDSPRITSPPSIRIYDFNNSNHDRPRLSTRSSSNASIPFSKSPGPMSIPNSKDKPPPPLPPPRHIAELEAGDDLGWRWGNTIGGGFGKSDLPTIKPGSSLYGSQDRRTQDFGNGADCNRRRSSASTIKLSPDVDTRWEGFRHKDEGYHSLSGSGIANLQSVVSFFLASSTGSAANADLCCILDVFLTKCSWRPCYTISDYLPSLIFYC